MMLQNYASSSDEESDDEEVQTQQNLGDREVPKQVPNVEPSSETENNNVTNPMAATHDCERMETEETPSPHKRPAELLSSENPHTPQISKESIKKPRLDLPKFGEQNSAPKQNLPKFGEQTIALKQPLQSLQKFNLTHHQDLPRFGQQKPTQPTKYQQSATTSAQRPSAPSSQNVFVPPQLLSRRKNVSTEDHEAYNSTYTSQRMARKSQQ